MLNAAVLSDLHFGDPYSLAHQQGVPAILDIINVHAQGHLRRLVLAGDIFEMSTPESMDAVRSQAQFFLQQAKSRFHIDQVIWVPGNHDYSLFRSYIKDRDGTSWAGEPAPQAFINDFFGPGWQVPVRIAYPHLHLCERKGGQLTGRSWVIHHGHYMDDLVLGRTSNGRAEAFFSALGGGRFLKPQQVPLDQPILLGQIEQTVRPLLEAIWQHHPDPNNLQNEIWDYVRRYNDYQSCVRNEPDLIISGDGEGAILGDYEMSKAQFYLRAVRRDPAYPFHAAPPAGERLTLIYGHTHQGGTRSGDVDGVPASVVNMGGWVAVERPTKQGREPHTHVYLINDDLQERLLHVPFPAGWAQHCLDYGHSIFAIPGPDDELVERVQNAPPAAGMSVDEVMKWQGQRPFGTTSATDDPFQ